MSYRHGVLICALFGTKSTLFTQCSIKHRIRWWLFAFLCLSTMKIHIGALLLCFYLPFLSSSHSYSALPLLQLCESHTHKVTPWYALFSSWTVEMKSSSILPYVCNIVNRKWNLFNFNGHGWFLLLFLYAPAPATPHFCAPNKKFRKKRRIKIHYKWAWYVWFSSITQIQQIFCFVGIVFSWSGEAYRVYRAHHIPQRFRLYMLLYTREKWIMLKYSIKVGW